MAISTTLRRSFVVLTDNEEAPVAKMRTWLSQRNGPESENKPFYEILESVLLQ